MTGSIERLQSEYTITVNWRPFPLHPDTPEEGLLLEELFRAEPEQIRQMVSQLKQVAVRLGLPFGDRRRTYNSRLAQELGLWAEAEGNGHSFHMAAFRSYFAEGKNLARHSVLLDLVEGCGLSRTKTAEVLVQRTFAALVDQDWVESRNLQVTAVPTFILGNSRLVGAQSYSTLQGLMLQHGVPRSVKQQP